MTEKNDDIYKCDLQKKERWRQKHYDYIPNYCLPIMET